MRMHSGTYGYLHLAGRPAKTYPKDLSQALVNVWINDQKIRLLADRMEGGQTLRLPEKTTERVIEAMQENHEVVFQLPGYRMVIPSTHFSQGYDQFLRVKIEEKSSL